MSFPRQNQTFGSFLYMSHPNDSNVQVGQVQTEGGRASYNAHSIYCNVSSKLQQGQEGGKDSHRGAVAPLWLRQCSNVLFTMSIASIVVIFLI